MGVYFDKSRNKFRVTTTVKGKKHYIGQYSDRGAAEFALENYNRAGETEFIADAVDHERTPVPPKFSLFGRLKAAWRK